MFDYLAGNTTSHLANSERYTWRALTYTALSVRCG